MRLSLMWVLTSLTWNLPTSMKDPGSSPGKQGRKSTLNPKPYAKATPGFHSQGFLFGESPFARLLFGSKEDLGVAYRSLNIRFVILYTSYIAVLQISCQNPILIFLAPILQTLYTVVEAQFPCVDFMFPSPQPYLKCLKNYKYYGAVLWF